MRQRIRSLDLRKCDQCHYRYNDPNYPDRGYLGIAYENREEVEIDCSIRRWNSVSLHPNPAKAGSRPDLANVLSNLAVYWRVSLD